MESLIKHFTGTKEQFIASGHDKTYSNHVVFIGQGGVGSYIYAKGEYHGGVSDILATLTYFSSIAANGKTASASGPNSVLNFTSDDPALVDIKIDTTGIHFSLTDEFKTIVNTTLPNQITAIDTKLGNKNAVASTGDTASAFARIKNLEEVVGGLTGDGDGVESVGSQINNAINALDVAKSGGDYVKYIEQVDGKIVVTVGIFDFEKAGAAQAVKNELNDSIGTLNNRVGANETAIATLKGSGEGSIDAMIAAAIAAVVANAPEDFNTLKEIADYIASDKTGAVNMNNAISANTAAINEIKTAWTIEEI